MTTFIIYSNTENPSESGECGEDCGDRLPHESRLSPSDASGLAKYLARDQATISLYPDTIAEMFDKAKVGHMHPKHIHLN